MTLPPKEVEQFYRIWMPLLGFVNHRQKINSHWPKAPRQRSDEITPETAIMVRDALWQNDHLLDEFLTENPAELSDDDLAIAATWKYRAVGDFTILRHVKNHTVFLQEKRVYAVLGLIDQIEEIVPFIPITVKASLLPFRDRIIIDGLLAAYNIHLGAGIRADLNATFKNASEGVGMITSLPMSDEQIRKNIAEGNARLLKVFGSALAGAGLSGKMQAQHLANVAQFGASLLSKDEPQPLIAADLAAARKFLDAHPSADTSLTRYARFLYETGRGDADNVFDLQELRRRK